MILGNYSTHEHAAVKAWPWARWAEPTTGWADDRLPDRHHVHGDPRRPMLVYIGLVILTSTDEVLAYAVCRSSPVGAPPPPEGQ